MVRLGRRQENDADDVRGEPAHEERGACRLLRVAIGPRLE
jgi:hypothetical protein